MLNEWLNEERGRASGLAERLDVPKSLVTRWRQSYVPHHWCAAVEQYTGIPAEALNPNVEWARIKAKGFPKGRPVAVFDGMGRIEQRP